MLRYLQERVNKATKEFDARPAEAKAGDAAKAQTDLLSSKQGRVQELMRKLANKLNKENDAEEGR
jgi:major membrane immunogen (membrane-anchored lipoprotein)